MAETIQRDKTYTLSKLILGKIEDQNIRYDIRAIFSTINIFSNIDSFITSGFITILEQDNLISKMPITGKEYIEIEFCTLDTNEKIYDTYHRTFFVYAIDNITEAKDGRSYCLRFTDCIGMLNNDIRLSIKYDYKFEDIVKQIKGVFEYTDNQNNNYYQKTLKETGMSPNVFNYIDNDDSSGFTDYNMKFVVPSWKPLNTLMYLCKRAVSNLFNNNLSQAFSDCFIFQNRKGEVIFTNYKKMFDTTLKDNNGNQIILQKRLGNLFPGKNDGISETKRYILNYQFSNLINFQMQKSSGYYGFTDHITNFLNKVSEPVKFSFKNATPDNPSIASILFNYHITNNDKNSYQLYEPLTLSENSLYTYNVSSINSNTVEDEHTKFVEPYQRSLAIRQIIENNKLIIQCQGLSDMDIGKSIKIDLGTNTGNDVKPISDYINNLSWVVSSVSHKITPDEFTTAIECYTPFINDGQTIGVLV